VGQGIVMFYSGCMGLIAKKKSFLKKSCFSFSGF